VRSSDRIVRRRNFRWERSIETNLSTHKIGKLHRLRAKLIVRRGDATSVACLTLEA
jgi:hypothetical protein